MIFFICNKCGKLIRNSEEIHNDILKRRYKCSCGTCISMENSYPSLNCQDFVLSANELLEQAKLKDRENLNIYLYVEHHA